MNNMFQLQDNAVAIFGSVQKSFGVILVLWNINLLSGSQSSQLFISICFPQYMATSQGKTFYTKKHIGVYNIPVRTLDIASYDAQVHFNTFFNIISCSILLYIFCLKSSIKHATKFSKSFWGASLQRPPKSKFFFTDLV